ncbi:hypothetical protein T439DRAFT_349855, partial [Meredithblackwellia eburnea MCA 4105]
MTATTTNSSYKSNTPKPKSSFKKLAQHKHKAYQLFSSSSGLTLDELVTDDETRFLWLVNFHQIGIGTQGTVGELLDGTMGVEEWWEFLNKPYVLVAFSTSLLASQALHHLSDLTTQLPLSRVYPIYVSPARPACVPPFLAQLTELDPPQPVTDEVIAGRRIKSWRNGVSLIEDFVTEAEEAAILEGVWSEEGWSRDLSNRQSRHAGPIFDYTTFSSSKLSHPIPPYLEGVMGRLPLLEKELERGEKIDQLTVQYYPAGTGIPPHVDTHSAFGESLFSLSLLSTVPLVLTPCSTPEAIRMRLPKRSLITPTPSSHLSLPLSTPPPPNPSNRPFSLPLPPRSLLVLTGEARYGFTHEIPPRASDQCGGRVVRRETRGRVSVTFRSV